MRKPAPRNLSRKHMVSFEHVKAEFTAHPYLFGGIAAVVALYFLWPHGSAPASNNASSLSAQEVAAISAASQSNAQLAMGQDQVQIAGLQTTSSVTIDAQDNAARTNIAGLVAGIENGKTSAALALGLNQTAADVTLGTTSIAAQTAEHHDYLGALYASQVSAQAFMSDLEKAHLAAPTLNVLGANIQGVAAPAPAANRYMPAWLEASRPGHNEYVPSNNPGAPGYVTAGSAFIQNYGTA